MKKRNPSKNFSTLIVTSLLLLLGSGCANSDFRGQPIAQSSGDQTGNPNTNPCPFGFDPEGGCLEPEFPPDDGGDGDPGPGFPTTNLTGAKSVASGAEHTCVLMKSNTVKCFGDNTYGQLGNVSAANPSPVAVDVTGLSGVTALVAGDYHTCALSGGSVYCWGRNNKGQLGNDTNDSSSSPVQAIGLSNIGKIAAGGEHTCATESNTTRRTFCWGSNDLGQLGIALSTSSLLKPSATRTFKSSSGTLYYADAISAGAKHTCLLTQNKIYCAGDNTYGQLGADIGTKSYPAVRVGGAIGNFGKYATAITLGAHHTCAMIEGEDLYCWGRNDLSQLAGATSATSTWMATRIFGADEGLVSANAGGNRVCALLDGGLSCWGEVLGASNSGTSPGLGFFVLPPLVDTGGGENPQTVSGLGTPLTHYELGGSHACAVVGEAVKCWGRNDSRQLGNAAAGSYRATPVNAQRPL